MVKLLRWIYGLGWDNGYHQAIKDFKDKGYFPEE